MAKAPDCSLRFTCTTDLIHLEGKVWEQDINLLLARSRGLYWGILARVPGSTKTTGHDFFIILPTLENKQYSTYNRKRSVRQTPDQERTNRNTRIYLETTSPDNNLSYTTTCGVQDGLYKRATLLSLMGFTNKTFGDLSNGVLHKGVTLVLFRHSD